MGRLFALVSTHRRRLARMLFGAGVLLVAWQLLPQVPRTTEFAFDLGDNHARVVELRVAFERGGEEMHGVSFGFPQGAPSLVRHTLDLPSGEYLVRFELRERGGGSREITRTLITPVTGVVHIALTEHAAKHVERPARGPT